MPGVSPAGCRLALCPAAAASCFLWVGCSECQQGPAEGSPGAVPHWGCRALLWDTCPVPAGWHCSAAAPLTLPEGHCCRPWITLSADMCDLFGWNRCRRNCRACQGAANSYSGGDFFSSGKQNLGMDVLPLKYA